MRYVLMLLGLLMAAFAAVQYNDPDALLWIVIYLIPAAWAFAAAFRPARVASRAGERLLWATVAAGVALTHGCDWLMSLTSVADKSCRDSNRSMQWRKLRPAPPRLARAPARTASLPPNR